MTGTVIKAARKRRPRRTAHKRAHVTCQHIRTLKISSPDQISVRRVGRTDRQEMAGLLIKSLIEPIIGRLLAPNGKPGRLI